MIHRQPVKQFFGDAEYAFHLSPDMVMELERRTGSGIGAVYKRCISSDFRLSDLIEVIRLGLIGGGNDPKEVADLVATYSGRLTIADLFMTAMAVLDALMSGAAPVQPVANSTEGNTDDDAA